MPYYFKSTSPEEREAVYGPFELLEEAETCRNAVLADRADHTTEEIFMEDEGYLESIPRPQSTITLEDGSFQELWTDGTSRVIPAE